MSRSHCTACGTAPSPHIILWIDALLGIAFSRLPSPGRFFLGIISPERLGVFTDRVTAALLCPLAKIGVVHFSADPVSTTSPRTRVLWREAQARGYTMNQIIVFGMPSELLRFKIKHERPNAWRYFSSMPDISLPEERSRGAVDDKAFFKKLLQDAGIPTPRGISCFRTRTALDFLACTHTSMVIKPRMGSRARHTTLDVRTVPDAIRAIRTAKQISPAIMVEEYIPGDLYRATCVGGKLIGVIHFRKPSIIADGTHTAKELLDIHNAHKKHATMTDVADDALFEACLRRQDMTRTTIPDRGVNLLLSEHSERPNGGYFVDCTDAIPADNKMLIERAAHVCGAPIIGFDILSMDLTRPRLETPFSFIEGNCAPFIELHDIPFEGTSRNVAYEVWRLWEETRPSRHTDKKNQQPSEEDQHHARSSRKHEIEKA